MTHNGFLGLSERDFWRYVGGPLDGTTGPEIIDILLVDGLLGWTHPVEGAVWYRPEPTRREYVYLPGGKS